MQGVHRRLNPTVKNVPEDALRELPAGASIVWQVTARLPDGTTADSTSFISRVE